RDAMPPPHLSANAPVLNVLQPLPINLFPMCRKEANQMFAHDCQRFLRLWIMQEPLLADPRLDRNVAPVAEADVVFVRLRLRQHSFFLQKLGRALARFETIEPMQFRNSRAIDPSSFR